MRRPGVVRVGSSAHHVHNEESCGRPKTDAPWIDGERRSSGWCHRSRESPCSCSTAWEPPTCLSSPRCGAADTRWRWSPPSRTRCVSWRKPPLAWCWCMASRGCPIPMCICFRGPPEPRAAWWSRSPVRTSRCLELRCWRWELRWATCCRLPSRCPENEPEPNPPGLAAERPRASSLACWTDRWVGVSVASSRPTRAPALSRRRPRATSRRPRLLKR